MRAEEVPNLSDCHPNSVKSHTGLTVSTGMQQKSLHAYTHCLCRVVAVPVLTLSLCRSLSLSFSVGLDPVDRPRLRRVCALTIRRSRGGTGGGGGGGAAADVGLGPGTLLWLWMGYTVAEFCTCEWCPWVWLEAPSGGGGGGGGGHGCLSSRRSLFSWLRRSNCTSSSSIRRRCVSSNFCWLSMMLLSSNRYSTARLGLSGLPWPVSMLKEPCTSEQLFTAGLMELWDYNHPKYESSPPHVMLVGGESERTKCWLLERN